MKEFPGVKEDLYLGMRIFRLEREFEEGKKPEKVDENPGPVAYADPSTLEYAVFPHKDIPRLRAYIRSTIHPHEVLRKAGKKGFPLYFQTFRRPFTNGKIYGILNTVTEGTMETKFTINCLHYDQRIHPALCISRNLLYPKESSPSPYYLEAKEKMKTATTREEKRRFRRELKKHSPTLDPYPKCRSCIMGKKLNQESCLGTQYDPEDKECIECTSKKECCQLMRLRIESILAGHEEKVVKELLLSWKKRSQHRKEVKDMAKTKKKMEDVSEEVVGTEATAKAEKAKAKKKSKAKKETESTKATKRKKTSKKTEEAKPEKKTKKDRKKKSSKDSGGGPVKKLLKELQAAKDEGDQEEARRIRAELRKAGYSLRAQANK